MDVERAVWTVAEFCKAYSLSHSKLYLLWAEGCGPRKFRVGARVYIRVEDAADWARGLVAQEAQP
jgi:hypothetical protein